MAANVVLFLLNEIYKFQQMWLFLNVLYVTVLLIKFYVMTFYILFGGGVVLTPKTSYGVDSV